MASFSAYSKVSWLRDPPVFADMLAFPQPEDAETLDGCPVLHLDDSAADTMYFLKALFDYEFFAPYPAKTDFDAIHGVLRLGTKYRVEPLRRRALQHLSSAHPTSLAAWDALCAASPAASTSTTSSHRGASVGFSGGLEPVGGGGVGVGVGAVVAAYAGPSFDPAHLELPILTLARAARAPWVLPTAFLRAAAALTSGTLTSLDILEGIDYTGVHVELERGDKVLLLEAGGVLLGEGTSELLGFLWSPTVCPGCVHAQPGASTSAASASSSASATAGNGPNTAGTSAPGVMNPCTANRLAMRVAAERWRSDALLPIARVLVGVGAEKGKHGRGKVGRTRWTKMRRGEADGDADVEEGGRAIWGEEDFARLSVCAPCLAYMKTDWATRRTRFWERLPTLFGLQQWGELERRRGEEMGWRL
ncbi:hypothetical protein MVEN_01086000 [Mycena venus]|uniref:BTB domain-containing protein n=1 Tax=Mycena venus TaxID=2733690 RepID=A0A8H6Y662_9AGAR|nr:hypothetical protein MVEN_01086000 [Mycena venus]